MSLNYIKFEEHSSSIFPTQLSPDLELLVEPEELLGVRPTVQGQTSELEMLLKWKNLPDYEATWEDYYMIQKQFP